MAKMLHQKKWSYKATMKAKSSATKKVFNFQRTDLQNEERLNWRTEMKSSENKILREAPMLWRTAAKRT